MAWLTGAHIALFPGFSIRDSPGTGPAVRWDNRRVNRTKRPSTPVLLVGASWLVVVASTAVSVPIDRRLIEVGRSDLAQFSGLGNMMFGLALLSAMVVGSALAVSRPRHPVGWLFVAFALSIAVGGFAEAYAAYGAVARPGSWPGAGFAAVVADGIFAPWLTLIALILLLTPTGAPPSPRWRVVAWIAVGGVALLVPGLLFSTSPLDPPFEAVANPAAWPAARVPVDTLSYLGLGGAMGAVPLAAASLLVRFRSAAEAERRQLKWMALVAVPLPLIVIATFFMAIFDQSALLEVTGALMVILLPVAAGLAISQYHLYEVDRLLSRALTYTLLSGLVVACYAGVVLLGGTVLSDVARESQVSAVLGTLVAVSIAWPARRRLQDALDRRFNRREFEAIEIVRRYVREPSTSMTVEQVLRKATSDASLDVAYWIDDRSRWVAQDGRSSEPGRTGIEVRRRGAPIAAITYDGGRIEQHVAESAAAEARPELENARLRAAIALQLVEVRESRARIVAAQLAERRKIERNLHDGAQQRLLGLAFQLRAAEVSGANDRTRAALDDAVDQIQQAVRELRDLANGLHPAILIDGGLAAALDDLAARTPVTVRLEATEERFAPDVEAAAWFIACEAVANAVKHACATRIEVSARRLDGHLVLAIADDGLGGADPDGRGLRGLSDRAEAAGGSLTVGASEWGGSLVRAELPCAS